MIGAPKVGGIEFQAPSEKPMDALGRAEDADLSSVVILGRRRDGSVYINLSPTVDTVFLLECAKALALPLVMAAEGGIAGMKK